MPLRNEISELEILDLIGNIVRTNGDSIPRNINFEDMKRAGDEERSRQLTGQKAAIINVYIREWVEKTLKAKRDKWDKEQTRECVRLRDEILKNTTRLSAFCEIRDLTAHEEKNLPSLQSIREILEEDSEFVALFAGRLSVQAGKLHEVNGKNPPISPEYIMRFWEAYMKELELLAKLLTDEKFASEGRKIFENVTTLPSKIRSIKNDLEFIKAFMKWAKPFVFLNCLPLEKDNPKLGKEFREKTTGRIYCTESRISDFWLQDQSYFPGNGERVEWSYVNLLEKAPAIHSNCAKWRGFLPSVGICTLRPLTIQGGLEKANKIIGNLNQSGDEKLTVDLEGIAHSIALRQQAWVLKHAKGGKPHPIASYLRNILSTPRALPFQIETGQYLEEIHTGLEDEKVRYSYTDNPNFALVIQERNVEMPPAQPGLTNKK